MAVFVVCLLLFFAMAGHSSATYCICKDGQSDSVLQKSIDYACGAGADCSPIQVNGACYNPNTVKDHCNYAVNSYFQKKGQVAGSCDFSGTATISQSAPTSQTTTCVYPASSSGTTPTPTTPSTTPPSTTTPTTPPPTSTTPTTTPPTTTTPTPPSTTTPSTTTPSTTTPATTPTFGLAPSGTGITSTDSGSMTIHQKTNNLFCSLALTLLLSGLMFFGA